MVAFCSDDADELDWGTEPINPIRLKVQRRDAATSCGAEDTLEFFRVSSHHCTLEDLKANAYFDDDRANDSRIRFIFLGRFVEEEDVSVHSLYDRFPPGIWRDIFN